MFQGWSCLMISVHMCWPSFDPHKQLVIPDFTREKVQNSHKQLQNLNQTTKPLPGLKNNILLHSDFWLGCYAVWNLRILSQTYQVQVANHIWGSICLLHSDFLKQCLIRIPLLPAFNSSLFASCSKWIENCLIPILSSLVKYYLLQGSIC